MTFTLSAGSPQDYKISYLSDVRGEEAESYLFGVYWNAVRFSNWIYVSVMFHDEFLVLMVESNFKSLAQVNF